MGNASPRANFGSGLRSTSRLLRVVLGSALSSGLYLRSSDSFKSRVLVWLVSPRRSFTLFHSLLPSFALPLQKCGQPRDWHSLRPCWPVRLRRRRCTVRSGAWVGHCLHQKCLQSLALTMLFWGSVSVQPGRCHLAQLFGDARCRHPGRWHPGAAYPAHPALVGPLKSHGVL